MEGRRNIGFFVAKRIVEARSLASPWANLAIKFAVAGATMIISCSFESSIWSKVPTPFLSKSFVYTLLFDNALTDKGVTNSLAASVKTHFTFAPVSYTHLTLPTNREV